MVTNTCIKKPIPKEFVLSFKKFTLKQCGAELDLNKATSPRIRARDNILYNYYRQELTKRNISYDDVNDNEYFKWLVGFSGLKERPDHWGDLGVLFRRDGWFKRFLEYWDINKRGTYADKELIFVLQEYFKGNNKRSQKLYDLALESAAKMVGYPFEHHHIVRIIQVVRENNEPPWEMGNIKLWKTEGILNKKFEGQDPIVEGLIRELQQATEGGALLKAWYRVNNTNYNIEEKMKEYGYDKYWKEKARI